MGLPPSGAPPIAKPEGQLPRKRTTGIVYSVEFLSINIRSLSSFPASLLRAAISLTRNLLPRNCEPDDKLIKSRPADFQFGGGLSQIPLVSGERRFDHPALQFLTSLSQTLTLLVGIATNFE